MLVLEHQPQVFFTQPRLQSPTGSVATLVHLHRVVQLAEQPPFTVVENDISADLDPEPRPSLASLDPLQRVVCISRFSKTISPNIRVACCEAPELLAFLQAQQLGRLTRTFSGFPAPPRPSSGRWPASLRK